MPYPEFSDSYTFSSAFTVALPLYRFIPLMTAYHKYGLKFTTAALISRRQPKNKPLIYAVPYTLFVWLSLYS
ncbi:hypothetical protein CHISP_0206 [Chitinispirillum alkaliphilum]|nr:hypothetical protein CHISP_0206 [Chitinispirillum alkaliphilum]